MDKNKSLEELKQDLVSEIEKRVADKIIEQANADLLKKLINQAETETETMDIAALGTTYKRTGFHFDKRLERISNNIKYKTKNEHLSFVNDASRPTHQLIIGDNYDALQNLLITHKNSIDVIYIDPPYGKDNMGDFAQTNYENSITRDNLLSMLYPRLLMAKRLLTPEDGIIFCSIDDKNQAYVKCLFDEVFGEENFVCNFIRRIKAGSGHDSREISIEFDYVLFYSKNKSLLSIAKECVDVENDDKYKLIDDFVEQRGKYYLRDLDYKGSYSEGLDYPITLTSGKNIYAGGKFGKPNTWRWSKQKFEWGIKNDFIVINERKEKIYIKQYQYVDNENKLRNREIPYRAIISYLNSEGTQELSTIFTQSVFDYPKPTSLIKFICNLCSNKSATILDFFAGSGTTGQAVMELNREDGGKRTFILCTNNEVTESNPNGIAYDVTAKRLKRVMSGKCYDGTDDFPWIKNNKPYMDNLNVYEIAQVSKTDHKKGETAFDKIDETCYGLPKFAQLTDKIAWICSNFENATKDIEKKEGE